MWQLWSYVPFSGHKAAQFVDLLGYFTVKSPEVKDKVTKYYSYLMLKALLILLIQVKLLSIKVSFLIRKTYYLGVFYVNAFLLNH